MGNTCNGQNNGELRLYVDGTRQQTFGYGRWRAAGFCFTIHDMNDNHSYHE